MRPRIQKADVDEVIRQAAGVSGPLYVVEGHAIVSLTLAPEGIYLEVQQEPLPTTRQGYLAFRLLKLFKALATGTMKHPMVIDAMEKLVAEIPQMIADSAGPPCNCEKCRAARGESSKPLTH